MVQLEGNSPGSVKRCLSYPGVKVWTQCEWRPGNALVSQFPLVPVKERTGLSVGRKRLVTEEKTWALSV